MDFRVTMNDTQFEHSLTNCRKRLEEKGFNLWGVARIDDFDPCQCREGRLSTVEENGLVAIVVGAGGRGLWELLDAQGRLNGHPGASFNPIDKYSQEVLDREVEILGEEGLQSCSVFPFSKRPIDFLKLAEQAGMGIISPVVPFLLHPKYGPWVSLRGALILNVPVEASSGPPDFDPCSDCDCPCLSACPVDVYSRSGATHLDRCASHRHAGNCQDGCAVRLACPIGQEHRYSEKELRFRNTSALRSLRRNFGLGFWRLVPSFFRRD